MDLKMFVEVEQKGSPRREHRQGISQVLSLFKDFSILGGDQQIPGDYWRASEGAICSYLDKKPLSEVKKSLVVVSGQLVLYPTCYSRPNENATG